MMHSSLTQFNILSSGYYWITLCAFKSIFIYKIYENMLDLSEIPYDPKEAVFQRLTIGATVTYRTALK